VEGVGTENRRFSLKNEPSRGESYADILRRHGKELVDATHESKPGQEVDKLALRVLAPISWRCASVPI
jgi:hypothetical protein